VPTVDEVTHRRYGASRRIFPREVVERRGEIGPNEALQHGIVLRVDDLKRCAMNLAACVVITGSAIFLLGLTAVVFAKPVLAERFFNGFASSARTHLAEPVDGDWPYFVSLELWS
jgi:hypothetical protein